MLKTTQYPLYHVAKFWVMTIFGQGLDTVEFDDDIQRSNTTVSLVSKSMIAIIQSSMKIFESHHEKMSLE